MLSMAFCLAARLNSIVKPRGLPTALRWCGLGAGLPLLAEVRHSKGGVYHANERLRALKKMSVPKICFSIHTSIGCGRQCALSRQ